MTATTTAPARWTTTDITDSVHRHLLGQWAVLREVTHGSDETLGERTVRYEAALRGNLIPLPAPRRRIDLLAFRRPQRRKKQLGVLERLALEVKVTRADFLNDVRHPEKQAPWREVAHRHAYVAPAGLIDPDEVPDGSGLLVVGVDSRGAPGYEVEFPAWSWAKRAPYTDTETALPDWWAVAMTYRAADAETRLRGRVAEVDGQDPVELAAEVARLRGEVTKTQNRLWTEQEAAKRWRELAAATGTPIQCATCGHGITVVNVRHRNERWRHLFPEHETECAPQRVRHYTDGFTGRSASHPMPIQPREDTP